MSIGFCCGPCVSIYESVLEKYIPMGPHINCVDKKVVMQKLYHRDIISRTPKLPTRRSLRHLPWKSRTIVIQPEFYSLHFLDDFCV